MPCAKRWVSGDHAWRCKTCELDPSCAICLDCFRLSDHEGHEVMMISTANGCCDCGDLEAWREEGCCTEHSPAQSRADNGDRSAVRPLPATMRPTAHGVVHALVTEWARALEELDQVSVVTYTVQHLSAFPRARKTQQTIITRTSCLQSSCDHPLRRHTPCAP